tara:strand:+ start:517 stop:879 length:363 start_codon:yes stop_codon:yes gene_type:complete
MFAELNNDNFEIYAAQNYDNPACLTVADFKEDIARFKYINRLLRKYDETGEIQIRLLLNHIIILFNVFEIRAANRMIFYRIDLKHWSIIKTILLYLNLLPDGEKQDVYTDLYITKKLKEL